MPNACVVGVVERVPDDQVDEAGGQAAAGRVVDDHRAAGRAARGGGEQRPLRLAERQAAGRDRRHADQAAHPVRRLVEHVLYRHAAHRVADQAEPVPAEGVGQGDRVGGGLGHGELAWLVAAGAVAAQVREDVGELRGVEVVGQVAPAEGGAEPAVQRDDVVVTGPDRHIRASHDRNLAEIPRQSRPNVVVVALPEAGAHRLRGRQDRPAAFEHERERAVELLRRQLRRSTPGRRCPRPGRGWRRCCAASRRPG